MIKAADRFLIVDDDITFAQIMQRALVRRGFTVDVFHAAEPAIKALEST